MFNRNSLIYISVFLDVLQHALQNNQCLLAKMGICQGPGVTQFGERFTKFSTEWWTDPGYRIFAPAYLGIRQLSPALINPMGDIFVIPSPPLKSSWKFGTTSQVIPASALTSNGTLLVLLV